MLKFLVKAGIATTAVYYMKQQGVWKNSDESVQTYEKLKTTVKPYVTQATAQLPFELPELPSVDRPSYLIKEYWNRGVMATFQFLVHSPVYAREYTKKGVDMLMENPEIKNFVNSFSLSESGSTTSDIAK